MLDASNPAHRLNLDLIEELCTRAEIGWKTVVGEQLLVGHNTFRAERIAIEVDDLGNEYVRVLWQKVEERDA